MAAHPHPAPETQPPEFPLLGLFAVLVIVALIPICLVIAVPSTVTVVVALVTVIGFAVAIAAVLSRIIGPE
jgi:hypothetical protein